MRIRTRHCHFTIACCDNKKKENLPNLRTMADLHANLQHTVDVMNTYSEKQVLFYTDPGQIAQQKGACREFSGVGTSALESMEIAQ